ncbi:MAG: ribosome biogenesis GTP-binding protein YihA/YsxC [Candidatus Hydrogenedentota bacterium]
MKVDDARFVKSAMKPEDYPRDSRPEVGFVGRSNVGKSTLLNTLLKRKGLAKTSGTPGKTRTINFFDVNGKVYFVDLPGYGYAKVPKTMKKQWQRFMTDYLFEREPLRLVVSLVDARHPPAAQDQEMLALLEEAQVPTLIAATKIDKLKRGERAASLRRIRSTLGLDGDAVVVPFSGVTGEGVRAVWEVIDEVLV